MRTFLVLNLYGPLQSWGQQAVGEIRPSEAHPTKSAILGMVAAAAGIPRQAQDIHKQLQQDLGFAVCIYSAGQLERDYHTLQAPQQQPKTTYYTRAEELNDASLNTLISTRDYRADAHYAVALWARNASMDLNAISESLKKPKFFLSLGRRACVPSLPLGPELIEAETLAAAFLKFKPNTPHHKLFTHEGKSCRVVWDDLDAAGIDITHTVIRRDGPGNKHAWTFSNRQEHVGSLILSKIRAREPVRRGEKECTSLN